MLTALGVLLPLGIAAAFSTIPLAVATVILLSARARPNGLAYLIGLAVGVFVVTLALSLGLGTIAPTAGGVRYVLLGAGEIALGVLLIGYGVLVFVRRPRPSAAGGRWSRALDRTPVWSTLGVGVVMSMRPKALLLSVAVGVAIAKGDLVIGETLIGVGVFTALAISAVAVPVVFVLVDPVRARRWLMAAKGFLVRHGRVLMLIVSVVVGVVLIGDGIARL